MLETQHRFYLRGAQALCLLAPRRRFSGRQRHLRNSRRRSRRRLHTTLGRHRRGLVRSTRPRLRGATCRCGSGGRCTRCTNGRPRWRGASGSGGCALPRGWPAPPTPSGCSARASWRGKLCRSCKKCGQSGFGLLHGCGRCSGAGAASLSCRACAKLGSCASCETAATTPKQPALAPPPPLRAEHRARACRIPRRTAARPRTTLPSRPPRP